MSDVQVRMEQQGCIICGELYATGNILLFSKKARKNSKIEDERYAFTDLGYCEKCQALLDDGYIVLIAVTNEPSQGKHLKLEEANRTGEICFLKRELANELFKEGTITGAVTYCSPDVMEKVKTLISE